MHNIITNFDQILNFAKESQAPVDKRRGVIRECLQSKFIATMYSLPNSEKLSFVGGTSLRLLRNSNRFSEDLDFDNLGLLNTEVKSLVSEVVRRFQAEGLEVELRSQIKEEKDSDKKSDPVNLPTDKTYFDLRFPNLLKELKISTNPREKLMIKIDYASFWKGQSTEVVLFNKYGFIENIVANKINQTLVQKLAAYVQRNTTQPRDIYDIVWLYSQGAGVDLAFAEINNLSDIVQKAIDKFTLEGIPENFKNKLAPFLFNSDDVRKLDLFGNVLSSLKA